MQTFYVRHLVITLAMCLVQKQIKNRSQNKTTHLKKKTQQSTTMKKKSFYIKTNWIKTESERKKCNRLMCEWWDSKIWQDTTKLTNSSIFPTWWQYIPYLHWSISMWSSLPATEPAISFALFRESNGAMFREQGWDDRGATGLEKQK